MASSFLASFAGFLAGLLALALLASRLPAARGPGSRSALVELGIAAAAGLATAVACGWWLGPEALQGGAVTGADFQEYCASVASLRPDGDPHWYPMRSRLAGLLPGLLSRRLGVLDGLAASALLGSAGLGASLYLWGLALHGRLAGLAAVAFSWAVPSLALAGRLLSFYPLITALLVASAAAAAMALRRRSGLALLGGACAAGLALLADGIGLIWALPCCLLLLLAALRAPRRRWPLRLALLLVPLLLAWLGGRAAFRDSHPLELQLSVMTATRPGQPGQQASTGPQQGYRPGWSNPFSAPLSLLRVATASGRVGQQLQQHDELSRQRDLRVLPWLAVLLAAGPLACLSLRRRPWLLLALLCSCLPFLAMLQRAARLEPSQRFLLLALPVVPLLLGLALAWSLLGPLPAQPERQDVPGAGGRSGWLRPALGLALVMALVSGLVPTPLSPGWPAREPFAAVPDAAAALDHAAGRAPAPNPSVAACQAALRADLAAGHPHQSRFFGPLRGE